MGESVSHPQPQSFIQLFCLVPQGAERSKGSYLFCSLGTANLNNYEWTWKYAILPTPIKNHRQSRVCMQTKHTNSRPFDSSVRKVKVRKRNAEEQCT